MGRKFAAWAVGPPGGHQGSQGRGLLRLGSSFQRLHVGEGWGSGAPMAPCSTTVRVTESPELEEYKEPGAPSPVKLAWGVGEGPRMDASMCSRVCGRQWCGGSGKAGHPPFSGRSLGP